MMDAKKETARFSLGPFYWVIFSLLIYAYYFFHFGLTPGWVFAGDSASDLFAYNFQYSGFARGEYPIWNPLNRSGEPLYFMQALTLANPLANLTIIISLLFGIKNIVLSLSVYFFLLTTLYVFGVYLLVLALTKNRFAATFGANDIAALLLAHGANPHTKDTHGKSALDYATSQQNNVFVKLVAAQEKNAKKVQAKRVGSYMSNSIKTQDLHTNKPAPIAGCYMQ